MSASQTHKVDEDEHGVAPISSLINHPSPSSVNDRIKEIVASATKAYSLKDYPQAADLYAQASILQASLNGETSSENADILYLYGRSLYQVGVSKSDVLGGKASDTADADKAKKGKQNGESSLPAIGEERVAEEVVQKVVESKDGTLPTASKSKDDPKSAENKPYFQFTGDENWDDSDPEAEADDDADDAGSPDAQQADGDNEEEEDDLTSAWNVLDLARVLLSRKLSDLQSNPPSDPSDPKGKGKAAAATDPPEIRHVKERLSDTHDLLAEISLEGEKFPSAVTDFRAALDLKKELYPQDSSLIAEAHYKLSLALEFASSTTPTDAQVPALAEGGVDVSTEAKAAAAAAAETPVDEAGREDAALEMEAAIASCRLRVRKEEAALASPAVSDADRRNMQAGVDDVKDMIKDMEQRVLDLRAPPVTFDPATSSLQPLGPAGAADPTEGNPLGGLLGSLLGESKEEQRRRVEEATKGARDLTGLVRRKKADVEGVPGGEAEEGKGKRKAEDVEVVDAETGSKKPRVEDADE